MLVQTIQLFLYYVVLLGAFVALGVAAVNPKVREDAGALTLMLSLLALALKPF